MQAIPQTEHELMQRCKAIAGFSIEELAAQHQLAVPANQRRMKGWVGQLLEQSLGADAGSLAVPDFQHLGIELKTIPITAQGKPLESTYVTVTPLMNITKKTWESSEVCAKLSKVLWVPIQTDKTVPLAKRRIGMAVLWRPSVQQEQILKQDWQELMDMVAMGQLEKIHAGLGTYLQIRPKAANAKSLCWGINEFGEKIKTLPRGFYLRAKFTEQILRECYFSAGA